MGSPQWTHRETLTLLWGTRESGKTRTSLAWPGFIKVFWNDLMDRHVTGGHQNTPQWTHRGFWPDSRGPARVGRWDLICSLNFSGIENWETHSIKLESCDSHLIYSNRRPDFSLVLRPRPDFRRLQCWKQWKAGWGLGMRLAWFSKYSTSYSSCPSRKNGCTTSSWEANLSIHDSFFLSCSSCKDLYMRHLGLITDSRTMTKPCY